MIAIETRKLTRRYGKLTAVENLDLKIPAGGLYGLIGPNGAGKTTTIRMLAGLLKPTSGIIEINGEVTNHGWQDLRYHIGYMPDFFGVYEDLLVWEYLDFFARCYGLKPGRRRQMVDELLELVDLTGKRDAFVQTLSRGMRQRLCLAHALVHDPKILLLDEPASGLDPRARVEMRALLRELQKMGKTIDLSSHIPTELAEICDYIGIIEKGALVASGSITDIRNQMSAERVLQVKVISDIERASQIIQTDKHVENVELVKGVLELRFHGDDDVLADFIETLVGNGVRFVSLQEKVTDLEDLFLQLTKGDVN